MANQVPAQPSLLDRLRERASTSLQDENVRRLSEFGTGMLSSNSPNFFTMLGAGFRAQEAGDASRMEQLRRAVEAERQEQALQNEATRRQEEARIQAQRYEQDRPLRAAQTEEALARAGLARQQTTNPELFSGRGRTGPSTAITPAMITRAQNRAAAEASIRFPAPAQGLTETEEARNTRIRNREEFIRTYTPILIEEWRTLGTGASPGGTPGTPATTGTPAGGAPAAVIDLMNRPVR